MKIINKYGCHGNPIKGFIWWSLYLGGQIRTSKNETKSFFSGAQKPLWNADVWPDFCGSLLEVSGRLAYVVISQFLNGKLVSDPLMQPRDSQKNVPKLQICCAMTEFHTALEGPLRETPRIKRMNVRSFSACKFIAPIPMSWQMTRMSLLCHATSQEKRHAWRPVSVWSLTRADLDEKRDASRFSVICEKNETRLVFHSKCAIQESIWDHWYWIGPSPGLI